MTALRSALASVRGGSLDPDLTLRWLLALIAFPTPDHCGQMVMVRRHLG
ncbi:MAG: hypothetical protein RDU89_02395 [bacterium]|nr:hypothetical protein [bacterium]